MPRPEDAIIDGMHQVCAKAGHCAGDIGQIIHGTTLATNALIERRGAKTALITTEGFRDVIEMRTESRFEQYDLNLTLPEPLLPRQRRYTVAERIDATGRGADPAGPRRGRGAGRRASREAGYESVAVGLIHSYLNDAHERLVREVLAETAARRDGLALLRSVAADARIRALQHHRRQRLYQAADEILSGPAEGAAGGRRRGLPGLPDAFGRRHHLASKVLPNFPVRLVESGPAGGAVFAADIAARYGLDKVLSFDMGGTTAKICLIKNQTPKTARVFEVARTYRFKKGSGMPISIPVIDMVEIGAGGGSLAHVDAMRQIRVGPESAGSEPGPACYGRGGDAPAVTDADLVLGKLDPDNFAGGSIPLARRQLREGAGAPFWATPLGMDAQTAAFGLAEVVDENMANAARVHAVENGEDLADYTMIAFGGAAPLHAGPLVRKAGRRPAAGAAGRGRRLGHRVPARAVQLRGEPVGLHEAVGLRRRRVCATLLAELEAEATRFRAHLRCDGADPGGVQGLHALYRAGLGNPDRADRRAGAATRTRATFQSLFEADYTKPVRPRGRRAWMSKSPSGRSMPRRRRARSRPGRGSTQGRGGHYGEHKARVRSGAGARRRRAGRRPRGDHARRRPSRAPR